MLHVDQYDYDLPRELIAQWPVAERADARLLVVDRRHEQLEHRHIRDLPALLEPGDCVVLNDTRVIPARLVGYRQRTGGYWQGLFLSTDEDGFWQLLCKTRGKLVAGETIELIDRNARKVAHLNLYVKLKGSIWTAQPDPDESPLELLPRVGQVPLPPYIRGGQMVDTDLERYQTVFARNPGSVAAPTAGLHFTDRLLEQLKKAGVSVEFVTLHVGQDTFQPIRDVAVGDHAMHSEWGSLPDDVAQRLQACQRSGHRIVAVGTTAVRVLETAASSNQLQGWTGATDLFIYPPFDFRAVDAMLTNFHLPRTTLLVLARTFGGDGLVQRAYQEAISERYRFYSYGDAMLIL